MFASLRIARVFGIPVQIHWTFSLLLLWIAYEGYAGGAGWFNTGIIALIILSLFFCVILHEFGHALMARRFGIDTHDITISPIGGIARLNGMPEKPVQEMWVALAGPMVNMVLAVLFAVMFFFLTGANWSEVRMTFYGYLLHDENYFLDYSLFEFFLISMIAGNTILALFNLLPAFPMDGGRVLRAIMAQQLGRPKATRIAAWVGQAFAIALAAYGFMSGMEVTGLVGLFVFFAASQENRSVQYESVIARFSVADAVRFQFSTLESTSTIGAAAHRLQHGLERSFLVYEVADEHVITSYVESKDILDGIREGNTEAYISTIAKPVPYRLFMHQPLKDAVLGFQEKDADILPVIDGDTIIGVVDRVGIDQFLASQSSNIRKPFFTHSQKS